MKIRQFCELVFIALVLVCFGAVTGAQQPSEQDLPTLTPPLHAALYPEVMCVHCVVPHWDHGYLFHVEFDRDPAVVTMYDRVGKKLLEARMEPPGATKVSILYAGATRIGGILAVGGGIMPDGSGQRFIVKSDPAGSTKQSVRLGDFYPRQVCEGTDGTVWVLGFESNYGYSADADRDVLRHYSFEKGFLNSFVSLDSISKSFDASLHVSSSRKSFLSCGKDRVSVFVWSAAQYIEVDTSNERITRWNVALPAWATRGKAYGFAVTENGRRFVGLGDCCGQEKNRTIGLFELNAEGGTSVATLVPIAGALTKYDPDEIPPDGTFLYLWGADGNELVVRRQGDGWGLSWARVAASATSSNSSVADQ